MSVDLVGFRFIIYILYYSLFVSMMVNWAVISKVCDGQG